MKICVVCDYCYPFRNDPTGKIAYLMANSFSRKGHDVIVYTNSFSFKQRSIQKKDNITYIINKSSLEENYSFSELFSIYKNLFLLFFAIIKLFFLKIFLKTKIIRLKHDKGLFFKGISEEKYGFFDLTIFVCGNYHICRLRAEDSIKSKKNILYAIDYWPSDYGELIHSSFDCVYGQCSYEEKKINFKGEYRICTPLIDSSNIYKKELENKKDNIIKVRYFGNLYGPRDYIGFLSVLNIIDNNLISVEVYSNLYKERKKYKNIVFKKQVYGNKYFGAFCDSDFLLVLDNDIGFQKWIPSKIYECMASNKPIIIFISNDNSFIKKETETYKNKIIVSLCGTSDVAIKQMISFIKNVNVELDFDFKNEFPFSDPDFFIEDILSLFEKP